MLEKIINMHANTSKVAILDAGAQYAKVIDRRVRELGVESVLLPLNTPAAQLAGYGAIIISGGPQSVYSVDAPAYDRAMLQLKVPFLGICYGMQLMVHASGGVVEKKARREDGPCNISVQPESALFRGLIPEQMVLMSHGDSVSKLPEGYVVTAESQGIIAAIECAATQRYGVQFHPEVDLTVNGNRIIENFICSIAALPRTYTVHDRQAKALEYIQSTVGTGKVLLLVSGGVDSSVCAALIRKALPPEQIIAVHIDSGMMRKGESAQVAAALRAQGVPLTVINAAADFFAATTVMHGKVIGPLHTVLEPQHKRQIIGDTFIKVVENYLQELNLDLDTVFLAQGTLRPDLIESASTHISSTASVIKTHHNDTEIVRALRARGRVIEPLAEYHKDEVRVLGEELGLPHEMVWRQPFPGPGLGIRILCATEPYLTSEYSAILKNLQVHVPKKYAVTVLPVRTVGVQGDGRTYSYVAALSCERDALSFAPVEWEEIINLARELPKYVHQINRVVWMFGAPVSVSVTSITPTLLTPDTVAQLQIPDAIVSQAIIRHNLGTVLSQVPVILVPVDCEAPNHQGGRCITIRTFITNDFMTGIPATPGKELPLEALKEMVTEVEAQTPGISRVLYDLTSKPPGTTEWE